MPEKAIESIGATPDVSGLLAGLVSLPVQAQRQLDADAVRRLRSRRDCLAEAGVPSDDALAASLSPMQQTIASAVVDLQIEWSDARSRRLGVDVRLNARPVHALLERRYSRQRRRHAQLSVRFIRVPVLQPRAQEQEHA